MTAPHPDAPPVASAGATPSDASAFRPDWRHRDDLPEGFNDLPEAECWRLMAERARLLHVYGAPQWHSSVEIVGNRNALTVLRDVIDAALNDGKAEVEVMASDGEGYVVVVEMDDRSWEHPEWERRPPHYIDPVASGRRSNEWMVPVLRDALRRANAQLVKRGVKPIPDLTREVKDDAL